ncbi:unnamed protein product, partial [Rotaria socialis]
LPGANGLPGMPGAKGEPVRVESLVQSGTKGERGDQG